MRADTVIIESCTSRWKPFSSAFAAIADPNDLDVVLSAVYYAEEARFVAANPWYTPERIIRSEASINGLMSLVTSGPDLVRFSQWIMGELFLIEDIPTNKEKAAVRKRIVSESRQILRSIGLKCISGISSDFVTSFNSKGNADRDRPTGVDVHQECPPPLGKSSKNEDYDTGDANVSANEDRSVVSRRTVESTRERATGSSFLVWLAIGGILVLWMIVSNVMNYEPGVRNPGGVGRSSAASSTSRESEVEPAVPVWRMKDGESIVGDFVGVVRDDEGEVCAVIRSRGGERVVRRVRDFEYDEIIRINDLLVK